MHPSPCRWRRSLGCCPPALEWLTSCAQAPMEHEPADGQEGLALSAEQSARSRWDACAEARISSLPPPPPTVQSTPVSQPTACVATEAQGAPVSAAIYSAEAAREGLAAGPKGISPFTTTPDPGADMTVLPNAASCIYRRVGLRLSGWATPLRRRSAPSVLPSEEASVHGLFAEAMGVVERRWPALASDAAWAGLKELLPLLAEAQSHLLGPELARCRSLALRRGRPPAVRFACYDLSALEPRPVHLQAVVSPGGAGHDAPGECGGVSREEAVLKLLSQIAALQRSWLADTPV